MFLSINVAKYRRMSQENGRQLEHLRFDSEAPNAGPEGNATNGPEKQILC